jgi:hypothetical protein
MYAIDATEMERHRDAVRYAPSHNRVEGQFLSPESEEIFEAYIRGEIDYSEIRQRLHEVNYGDHSYR